MYVCVCVCVCLGIHLEGRGRPGWATGLKNWNITGAIAGRTQASNVSGECSRGLAPGRSLTEIGNYIHGTVLEAEREVRVKGREQRMLVEGASI